MKRIAIAAVVLLGTATAVVAQTPQAMYKDLIRPNGHPRSDAIHQADVDACYAQTGNSRYEPDGPAMKQCMRSRGYQFKWQRGFASNSGGATAGGNWRIHVDGAHGASCMQTQTQTANLLEMAGADPQLIQALRTRCLPQDHNPADYDPANPFYVAPNN